MACLNDFFNLPNGLEDKRKLKYNVNIDSQEKINSSLMSSHELTSWSTHKWLKKHYRLIYSEDYLTESVGRQKRNKKKEGGRMRPIKIKADSDGTIIKIEYIRSSKGKWWEGPQFYA